MAWTILSLLCYGPMVILRALRSELELTCMIFLAAQSVHLLTARLLKFSDEASRLSFRHSLFKTIVSSGSTSVKSLAFRISGSRSKLLKGKI